MDNENNWENFWQEWRNNEVKQEEDLYFQVGLTVNKKPIDKEAFDLINKSIVDGLALNKEDILVEFCCGNGLTTFELKDKVKQIIATDFAAHLINTAKQFKSAPNITYNLGNVFEFLENFNDNWQVHPNKYLMNNSLAYFTPQELENIFTNIIRIAGDGFVFLVRGVPNDLLKWNFYNTEERKLKYFENQKTGSTNDGLGRWWAPDEIKDICNKLNLKCDIRDQPAQISNYRMDIVITGKKS